MMKTVISAFLLVIFVVLANCAVIEQFHCKSGQEFIQNDCNHCYCLKHSELVCRINKCEHSDSKQGEQCETGTVWWKGCNKCWCVISGTVCTNYDCPKTN
ncbi:hypothetical protein RI129_011176 [Pyrocoelia pectoralis]|uniref:Protease inhibitor n=1 Tax=Pyrocoelia pectoralis TaxID=417401 RepID=A0AAN7V0I6_9COLE